MVKENTLYYNSQTKEIVYFTHYEAKHTTFIMWDLFGNNAQSYFDWRVTFSRSKVQGVKEIKW